MAVKVIKTRGIVNRNVTSHRKRALLRKIKRLNWTRKTQRMSESTLEVILSFILFSLAMVALYSTTQDSGRKEKFDKQMLFLEKFTFLLFLGQL